MNFAQQNALVEAVAKAPTHQAAMQLIADANLLALNKFARQALERRLAFALDYGDRAAADNAAQNNKEGS